ncbi:MAG: transposase [Solobacterium sp.]|nr:transposase [Solobacterium sp.]
MKLSYEEKIEIYKEWKVNHKSATRIAKERNLTYETVNYMVHLADLHGPEILEHKWNYFSPEYKENAIKRVFIGKESVHQVSLDLGSATQGTLARWIKEYKENGYTVIERKRGRHAKEEKDNGRTSGRERGTVTTERRASPEESQAYDTDRIRKKKKYQTVLRSLPDVSLTSGAAGNRTPIFR